MKYYLIISAIIIVAGCQPHTSKKNDQSADHRTMDMDERTMSDSAKQLLIDISNDAWFQVQMANVILQKAHDTALLNLAQNTSRQYTRIKDRAKIVSIPYRLNIPYFLTHTQNATVDSIQALGEREMKNEFVQQCNNNNQVILQKCDAFESLVKNDSDILHFIDFSKNIVTNNGMQSQRMQK